MKVARLLAVQRVSMGPGTTVSASFHCECQQSAAKLPHQHVIERFPLC